MNSALLGPLFSSAAMQQICGDACRLQSMLDFEAALAHAQAKARIIPAAAVPAIEAACRAELYDFATLGADTKLAGNLAIPLVKALTQKVAASDADAARYVHWGATSQDVIDTGMVLQLRAAIDALLGDLARAVTGFAEQAGQHRTTPMAGRTLLQHALPIPFGLKLAGYAAALARSAQRLQDLRNTNLVLQFGGAAGSLASLGEHGLGVAEHLAAELNLPLPDAPWHTHRDRLTEIAGALGVLAGTCGKIGRDIQLLMQTEIGEVFEPLAQGRGSSSALPHKRNPVLSTVAVAAANHAPGLVATLMAAQVQDNERSAGPWHAEWQALPSLLLCVSGGLEAIADLASGMEVDATRMRANFEITQGLAMSEAVTGALAVHLGKSAAHHLVEAACKRAIASKTSLLDSLAADEQISAKLPRAELEKLFDPNAYFGSSQAFIDRLLKSAKS